MDEPDTVQVNEQNPLNGVVKVTNRGWKEEYSDIAAPKIEKSLNMTDIFATISNVSNNNVNSLLFEDNLKSLDCKENANIEDCNLNLKNKDINHSLIDLAFDTNHNKQESIKSINIYYI